MDSALLYVRVSSKEQEREGYSLDAQEKLGFEYALRKNLKIVKRWKVSESAWNNKKERSAFNQMVEYAKNHSGIEHIIFDITDRMTRNDFDKLKIIDLIQAYNKTIHFARSNKTYNRDSSSDDIFMLDIEVAVAKKMSNDISRKTKMGMQEKAEQGLYPSGAPLGYINNKATHLMDIDEERARFIKKAFSLIASGSYSLGMLADTLKKEGFRPHKSQTVNKSTLSHFLKNPVYYGVFRWKDKIYQGNHSPLISKEIFDKAQDVLNGRFHPNVSKNNFPFNNLAICGICNCKVLGERKKDKYNYYHCTFSKGRHKGIGYIPEARLAKMLEEPVKNVTLPKEIAEWLKEGLRERSKNALELQEKRLNTLKNQQDRVNARLNRLFDMRIDKEIEEDVFKAKEQEYKEQLIEIKAQFDNNKGINQERIEDACRTFELSNRLYPLYVKGNYEEKAKIAKTVASNFTLNDATLYPAYKKPFNFFAEGLSRPNWLPRMESNHDSQIQNLKSYRLDDRANSSKEYSLPEKQNQGFYQGGNPRRNPESVSK